MSNTIRLAGVIKESVVNGEGLRYSIFFQGCNHKCEGCHSPHTWDKNGGYLESIESILMDILKHRNYIDGVSLSGGDPLLQYDKALRLCKIFKELNISVWMWTGFNMKEIKEKYPEILDYVNVIVDDRFDKDKPTKKEWRGSDNQTMWIKKDGRWSKDD